MFYILKYVGIFSSFISFYFFFFYIKNIRNITKLIYTTLRVWLFRYFSSMLQLQLLGANTYIYIVYMYQFFCVYVLCTEIFVCPLCTLDQTNAFEFVLMRIAAHHFYKFIQIYIYTHMCLYVYKKINTDTFNQTLIQAYRKMQRKVYFKIFL